jgi:hypothetical protein
MASHESAKDGPLRSEDGVDGLDRDVSLARDGRDRRRGVAVPHEQCLGSVEDPAARGQRLLRPPGQAAISFLADLKDRGLGCPLLIISDGAPGLTGAVEQSYPKALRQRCLIHRLRNIPRSTPPPRPPAAPPGTSEPPHNLIEQPGTAPATPESGRHPWRNT